MKSNPNNGYQVGDVVIVNLNGLCCLGIIIAYKPGNPIARVALSSGQIKQELGDLTFVERTGLTSADQILKRVARYTQNWDASTQAQVTEYPDRFAQMTGIGNCPPFVIKEGHSPDQFVIYYARQLPASDATSMVLTDGGFKPCTFRIFAVEVYQHWFMVRNDLQIDVANALTYFDAITEGGKPTFYIGRKAQSFSPTRDEVNRFDLCPYCNHFTRNWFLDTPGVCMCSYTEATAPTIPANAVEKATDVITALFV